mmetsp:Transcript_35663/g.65609  ORF Transcript_35663/g.65609 Transcript_35663/m.65609 type:complete len:505 (-) Transcript_35663:40-1554(-)
MAIGVSAEGVQIGYQAVLPGQGKDVPPTRLGRMSHVHAGVPHPPLLHSVHLVQLDLQPDVLVEVPEPHAFHREHGRQGNDIPSVGESGVHDASRPLQVRVRGREGRIAHPRRRERKRPYRLQRREPIVGRGVEAEYRGQGASQRMSRRGDAELPVGGRQLPPDGVDSVGDLLVLGPSVVLPPTEQVQPEARVKSYPLRPSLVFLVANRVGPLRHEDLEVVTPVVRRDRTAKDDADRPGVAAHAYAVDGLVPVTVADPGNLDARVDHPAEDAPLLEVRVETLVEHGLDEGPVDDGVLGQLPTFQGGLRAIRLDLLRIVFPSFDAEVILDEAPLQGEPTLRRPGGAVGGADHVGPARANGVPERRFSRRFRRGTVLGDDVASVAGSAIVRRLFRAPAAEGPLTQLAKFDGNARGRDGPLPPGGRDLLPQFQYHLLGPFVQLVGLGVVHPRSKLLDQAGVVVIATASGHELLPLELREHDANDGRGAEGVEQVAGIHAGAHCASPRV